MALRFEFKLLETQSHELFWNGKTIGLGFLNKMKDQIILCEYIAETDKEKLVIEKAKYWWKRRSSELDTNSDVGPRLLPPVPSISFVPHKNDFTEKDRKFLRSLWIASDEPPEEKDDGA